MRPSFHDFSQKPAILHVLLRLICIYRPYLSYLFDVLFTVLKFEFTRDILECMPMVE